MSFEQIYYYIKKEITLIQEYIDSFKEETFIIISFIELTRA